MTCEQMRVALSARLDGEQLPLPAPALESHLVACRDCRAWRDGAERVGRAVGDLRDEAPDLTASIMQAVAAEHAPAAAPGPRSPALPGANRTPRPGQAPGRRQIVRVAVAAVAVAQLALAIPVLLGGLGMAADPHTSREVASLEIALAVGFGFAAYRPARARALVPVAFVLAACLAGTSLADLVTAKTAVVHEVGHLAAVAQAVLLLALSRYTPPAVSPPAGPATAAAVPA